MSLQYVKGSYMDEIMFGDKPVLFTLEGLDEKDHDEAVRYSKEIWDWILQHHARVLAHAPLIANFKNKKWRSDGEREISADEIRGYLNQINSVYVNSKGGFDIFFDTNELFQERSIVVRVGRNFVFEGFSLL